MNEELIERIERNMRDKSTSELLEIWVKNDRIQWSDEAFEVVKKILVERGESIPTQNEMVVPIPPRWRWKDERMRRFFAIFLSVSIIGFIKDAIYPIGDIGLGAVLIYGMLFIIVIGAVFTDRNWSIIARIGFWALIAFPLFAFAQFALIFLFAKLLFSSGVSGMLINDIFVLITALPLFMWAMRRSKYFVEEIE